jgi:hypothetical protein
MAGQDATGRIHMWTCVVGGVQFKQYVKFKGAYQSVERIARQRQVLLALGIALSMSALRSMCAPICGQLLASNPNCGHAQAVMGPKLSTNTLSPPPQTYTHANTHALPGPRTSLCFSLYATRSARVKPSWAHTKLMDA